jgi:hypothetical protein
MILKTDAKPFVVAASFLFFFISACGIFFTAPLALSGHVDFRTQYTAGYMARSGHGSQLYDYETTERFQDEVVSPANGALPFEHLAYESLIYAPISFLGYRTAYVVFFAANLTLLVVAFGMFKPYLSALEEVWTFLPAALFACFLPVAMVLIQGQDSIILLALMVSSSIALDRGKDLRGGILLGVTLFKFQYALPIALLFLIWRRWRFITGFVLSSAVVIGVSLWITGTGGFLSYLRLLTEMSARFSSGLGARYGIHPESMQNLRGFAFALTSGSPLATHAITVVLSLFVLTWAAVKRPSFPRALLAALLVSYHQVITDTTLMLLPLGLVLAASCGEKSRNSTYRATLAVIIFAGQAPVLLAGSHLWLLAIPTLALFVLWE